MKLELVESTLARRLKRGWKIDKEELKSRFENGNVSILKIEAEIFGSSIRGKINLVHNEILEYEGTLVEYVTNKGKVGRIANIYEPFFIPYNLMLERIEMAIKNWENEDIPSMRSVK